MNTQPNNKTGKGNAPHRATYVVNDRLVQAKSYGDARKLQCTKAPIPYTEALAKERDQLRAKLNRMTAQRDELLAALKALLYTVENTQHLSDYPTRDERDNDNTFKQRLHVKAIYKSRAAISKAEQPQH